MWMPLRLRRWAKGEKEATTRKRLPKAGASPASLLRFVIEQVPVCWAFRELLVFHSTITQQIARPGAAYVGDVAGVIEGACF